MIRSHLLLLCTLAAAYALPHGGKAHHGGNGYGGGDGGYGGGDGGYGGDNGDDGGSYYGPGGNNGGDSGGGPYPGDSGNGSSDSSGPYSGNPGSGTGTSTGAGPYPSGGTAAPGKLAVYYDDPNAGWVGTVGVGGQPLKLLIDTGSADFWVLSDRLPKNKQQSASGGVYKIPQNVPRLNGGSWDIQYADGSGARGDVVVYDTVTTEQGMSVPNMAIECATQTMGQPGDQSSGGEGTIGLIGMSFAMDNTVTTGRQHTPQKTLWEQAGFGYFTTHLGPPENKDIWIGIGYDEPTARGNQQLTYQPIDSSQGFMGVDGCQTTLVGGQTIQNAYQMAILDTGTTMTYMDQRTVEQIYRALPGGQKTRNGDFVYDCDSQLPSISLSIGSKMLELDMSAFNAGRVTRGVCAGAIQPTPPGGGGDTMYIYGTQVFKSAYFSFEMDQSGQTKVGWAPYASASGGGGGGSGDGGSNYPPPDSNGNGDGGSGGGSSGGDNGGNGGGDDYPYDNGSGDDGYPFENGGGDSDYPYDNNGDGYSVGGDNSGSYYKQVENDTSRAVAASSQTNDATAKVANILAGLKDEDLVWNKGRLPRSRGGTKSA